MIFTREDILKIQNALLQLSRKDSEFEDANTPLSSEDYISILQDGVNKKVSINNLLSTLGLLKKDDFINVSDRYDEYYIQLSEAVTIIAKNKRKKGLVITFQDLKGDWKIYQFTGEISNFVKTELWKGLFDFKYPIVNSVLPDEEDLTLTYPDREGNSFILLKDKAYDPGNLNGKATKILRKHISEINGVRMNILTLEDFDQENCIYEIKYDFNLNNKTITVPSNCTLKFSSGSLNNGSIIGENLSTINYKYSTSQTIFFPEGINLSGSSSEVIASEVGMIPDLSTRADYNGLILDKVLSSHRSLILDGAYHIKGKDHIVDFPFRLSGGELHLYGDSRIFKLSLGASLYFDNVHFKQEVYESLLVNLGSINFLIKDIIITNCIFEGRMSIIRLWCSDIPFSEENPHGLEKFIVNNCIWRNTLMSQFALNDAPVTKEFRITNNYVDNMVYVFLSQGTTNEFTNKNPRYSCPLYFENNIIEGGISDTSSYVTPLLCDGIKYCYYRNNNVRNVINIGKGAAYDCYGTASNYYVENNHFYNIWTIPKDGVPNATPSEIFKGKGAGNLKSAIGNEWIIDFNEVRLIAKDKALIELTDELFAAVNYVLLFGYTAGLDTLLFKNNKIKLINGKLKLRESSFPVRFTEFTDNIIEADLITGCIILRHSLNLEYVLIKNNRFIEHTLNSVPIYPLGIELPISEYPYIEVSNNISSRLLTPGYNGVYDIFKDNITLGNYNSLPVLGIIEATHVINRSYYMLQLLYNYIIGDGGYQRFSGILTNSYRYFKFLNGGYMRIRAGFLDIKLKIYKLGDLWAVYNYKNGKDTIATDDKLSTVRGNEFIILTKFLGNSPNILLLSNKGDIPMDIEVSGSDILLFNKYETGDFKFDSTAGAPLLYYNNKWNNYTMDVLRQLFYTVTSVTSATVLDSSSNSVVLSDLRVVNESTTPLLVALVSSTYYKKFSLKNSAEEPYKLTNTFTYISSSAGNVYRVLADTLGISDPVDSYTLIKIN